jgi:hypothetical protein
MPRKTALQRFFDKVDTSGECWNWTASTFPSGYGVFKGPSGSGRSHRWLYEEVVGPVGGLVIRHQCDNRQCVRLDHLIPGSHADNQTDKVLRDRSLYGARNGRAKLTPSQALEIRQRFDDGEPLTNLAQAFGISTAAVWLIGKRRNWRCLAA